MLLFVATAAASTLFLPVLALSDAFLTRRAHKNIVQPDILLPSRRDDNTGCISPDPANTITDRLNFALNSSGSGFILQLCPNTLYMIQAPILFAAPNQEISTLGYPTDDSRATLVVSGPVSNGTGHTTAIDGTCANCDGVRLRNIQINGTRAGAPPTAGGANIEMGGANSNQLIEYVHSYDPRGWSCLHIAEGGLVCNNATVQNNDIGPCGSDVFQQWADGISISCRAAVVRNNLVNNPTDGGVVLFGSPGSLVENNTIWVVNNTLLGGINMVDVTPWGGDYTGTIVRNNTIIGGFATDSDSATQVDGANVDDVIVKIGIAIGPQAWFNDFFGANVSFSGTVLNNQLTGAFGYGIAVTSARNFTVEGNILFGNTSFIGSRGPNCSASDPTPTPAAFVIDQINVTSTTVQAEFQAVQDANGLTCVQPPDGGDYWPYGGNPSPGNFTPPLPVTQPAQEHGGHNSAGAKAGLAIGIIFAVMAIAIAVYFIRKWALNRQLTSSVSRARANAAYVKSQ
ncbi:pectin lyase fold/virulence factor [Gloeopeniophorella convolvens]|nr:pectin lyase fold/virulence factor [Gloeopeniophorella convolvens]